ncbi:MAG: (2Fe-2S) ferredoxin domain-containing protein [Planctomycetia bacterium]|nr:(2Fe-2S) ferredoxin domain-containing protein [Planctomycetia bacterium]
MKIRLEICCGTTCYMLGANKLLHLEDQFPPEWRGQIDVSAVPCNDVCNEKESLRNAPFVKINGEWIGNATPERVMELLAAKMQEE